MIISLQDTNLQDAVDCWATRRRLSLYARTHWWVLDSWIIDTGLDFGKNYYTNDIRPPYDLRSDGRSLFGYIIKVAILDQTFNSRLA